MEKRISLNPRRSINVTSIAAGDGRKRGKRKDAVESEDFRLTQACIDTVETTPPIIDDPPTHEVFTASLPQLQNLLIEISKN